MTETRPNPVVPSAGKADPKGGKGPSTPPADFARETIESVVIAFVLAFLFRTFVAEAFVIPTGSMATTLMGAHKDLKCPNCNYWYQVSASSEFDDEGARRALKDPDGTIHYFHVAEGVCPNCSFPAETFEETSYKGDRIIVTKFGLRDPDRWDVVVFRFPERAGTNYIKRLVGLPGERLRIRNGDLHARPERDNDEKAWRILRKPPDVVLAMLREVYDNQYVVDWMTEKGWPPRWQPCPLGLQGLLDAKWSGSNRSAWPQQPAIRGGWSTSDGYRTFSTDGAPSETVWLRYQHFHPGREFTAVWRDDLIYAAPPHVKDAYYSGQFSMEERNLFRQDRLAKQPEAEALHSPPLPGHIHDFAAYNYGRTLPRPERDPYGQGTPCWVGDLALECDVTASGAGEVVLELVEGPHKFHCVLDLANRDIRLSADDGRQPLDDAEGRPGRATAAAKGALPAGKSFKVMFANVDSQLLVWIDGKLVQFDGPTTYSLNVAQDQKGAADLTPVGIGAKGAQVSVSGLRLFRDIYYLAQRGGEQVSPDYEGGADEYPLDDDQFFVLGDNSAKSSDARAWSEQYVKRDLLIGKALFIYWPHSWDSPLPFTPNWKRMRFIK